MKKVCFVVLALVMFLIPGLNVSAAHASNISPMYRYYNPTTGDHFYTTDLRELEKGKDGYRREGIEGHVFTRRSPGTIPLHRYWNGENHFYTTDFKELGKGRNGYVYEGIECYVYSKQRQGTVPLYRYSSNNDHFYTTDFRELGRGRDGYVYEGIQCYILK